MTFSAAILAQLPELQAETRPERLKRDWPCYSPRSMPRVGGFLGSAIFLPGTTSFWVARFLGAAFFDRAVRGGVATVAGWSAGAPVGRLLPTLRLLQLLPGSQNVACDARDGIGPH